MKLDFAQPPIRKSSAAPFPLMDYLAPSPIIVSLVAKSHRFLVL
jgi:hypothetical protein